VKFRQRFRFDGSMMLGMFSAEIRRFVKNEVVVTKVPLTSFIDFPVTRRKSKSDGRGLCLHWATFLF